MPSAARSSPGAERRFRLADGRAVTYSEYGVPDGFPVLALHGTPGSRLKYAVASGEAHRLGLRLISPDRWAYGRTDPHPSPSLAAYASDTAELLDSLSVNRFLVVGISGGGPFAAAVAAMLWPRVRALALVAPVGPIAGAVDPSELGLLHRLCFVRLARRPRLLSATFLLYRGLLAVAPKTSMRALTIAAAQVDKALVREPDVRDHLCRTFRAGLDHRVSGPCIDLALFSRPWQVPLEALGAPTRIWLGTEDRNVPQEAVRALAGKLRQAELTSMPGQGHFWISRHYRDVLAWLAAQR